MKSRDSILKGVRRAAELQKELGLREILCGGSRPVDVMDVIRQLGLALLFRPLDSLLGAYVPGPVTSGILITTKRDQHVQRFTAAHELGHHVLNHRAVSVDCDVGYVGRGALPGDNGKAQGAKAFASYSDQELEADSFAAEFLLPKWLVVSHVRRQGWGRSDLRDPNKVYQLSLRLGASYSATCCALRSNELIDYNVAANLMKCRPRECKRQAFPDWEPEDWYRDVWLLTDQDTGCTVLGSADDVVVLSLREMVSSGHVWDVAPLMSAGLQIDKDERVSPQVENLGASVTRRLIAHGVARSHVQLTQRRPWESGGAPVGSFELDLKLTNRELGLPFWERPTTV